MVEKGFAFWTTTVLFLGAGLAGCAEPDAAAEAKGLDQVSFGADTGAVRGVVRSEEELPVAGAEVALQAEPGAEALLRARSNEEGVFVFSNVPPATYVLMAQALGYASASKEIQVRAGILLQDVVFVLGTVAADAAYARITVFPVVVSGFAMHVKSPTPVPLLSQPGDSGGCLYGPAPLDPSSVKSCQGSRSGCDGICEVHYGHCGATEGRAADWANYGCDFNHEWKTIISELDSVPQTTTTGKGWAFTTFGPNVTRSGDDWGSVFFDDPRAFRNTEEAPIYVWVDEEVLVERGIAPEDWCCDWGWRIFPAPCAVNGCDTYVNFDVMQDQRATIYFSYFIREPAPEGWTAVEDV